MVPGLSVDMMVVVLSGSSFVFFLLVHATVSRFFKTDQVFKTILITAFIGFLGNLVLTVSYLLYYYPFISSISVMGLCALSLVIDGLMVFVYVLCVFGPYETSIRMRIVRELEGVYPQGLSEQEILQRYNTKKILQVRLKRLLGAKDVRCVQGRYAIIQKPNMFFIIDQISHEIKKWVSPPLKGSRRS